MKNLKVFTLGLLFSTVFIFSGCQGGGSSDAENVQSKETEKEVIEIGAILPLTGNMAFLGEPIKYATDIAVDEINNDGGINGRELKVVYQDSKASPSEGVTATKKLIEVNKVPIVTTFLTAVSEACKPITEKSNTLLLAQTVSPSIYRNSKSTIRFHYNFSQEGEILLKFIRSKNPSKVALIHSSDPSTTYEFDSLIAKGLENKSIPYLQEKFNVGTKDFKIISAKVKEADCDLIVLGGYGNDIAFLLRDLNSMGVSANDHLICGNIGFIEIPKETNMELYNNTFFTTPPFMMESNKSAHMETFIKKYKQVSGYNEVGYSAYYAYDLIQILGEVLKNQKKIEPIKIKEMFTGEHQGIGGKYIVESSGDVKTEIIIGTYTDGKIESVKLKK